MKRLFLLLPVIVLGMLSHHIYAQTNISGQVIDGVSFMPITSVNIHVQGKPTGTTTDKEGNYVLEIPVGDQVIIFSHISYTSLAWDTRKKIPPIIYLERKETDLNAFVITAERVEQSTFNSHRSMTVATRKEINQKNAFSALDVFDEKIGIWVEKRTTSSSDPIIRGLSGANILALVDGNSLTTYWGEGGFAGDDMYGKIDAESIEKIEVIRGPASVMYGSNALGGVINFITKTSPIDYTDSLFLAGSRIRFASGSASDFIMARSETWGATNKVKYFIGATSHASGDMRVGGGQGYVVPSGGRDNAADANVQIKLSSGSRLSLGAQLMIRPETFRSYRPTQYNDNRRFAFNTEYQNNTSHLLYDALRIGGYYQHKRDTRYWCEDENLTTIENEGYALWNTLSGQLHATKFLDTKGMHRLQYGISMNLDLAESPDDEQFTMLTLHGKEKGSPDTRWSGTGIYLRDAVDLSHWITLSAGIRADHFVFTSLDNIFYTKPGDPDPATNQAITDPATSSQQALTGSASGVFHINNGLNVTASWAHGFRMFPPSFGIRQTGQGVLIPNGLLDPITSDLFESSVRIRTSVVELNLTGYLTRFNNFQSPTYGAYEGNTHIDFNNNGTFEPDERVYVNTPNGDAYVNGIEAEASFDLGVLKPALNGFHLYLGGMYNYGRVHFPDKASSWLRHTHPSRGLVKLRYTNTRNNDRFWLELVWDIVDRFDEVNKDRLTSDVGYLENPQDPNSGLYASYGLPSYNVLDVRGGVKFGSHGNLTLGLENILDIRYRTAHSRMDASGRNVQVGLDYFFGNQ